MPAFVLFLVGCGGNNVANQPTFTTGAACHKAFVKKGYNKPYEIKGITYHPQKHYNYSEVGLASFYGGGDVFHGRKTSNGEIFDMNRLSAAHKTVPIPCVVLVTNLENGRSIRLKINDRGPFIDGRIIDVSRKAARMLGFEQKGLAKVKVETLVPDSIVLADSMAGGSRTPMPYGNNQIVLADASSANPGSNRKHQQSHAHMNAGLQLASQQSNGSKQKIKNHQNTPSNQSPFADDATIYSSKPLPDIILASGNNAIKNNSNALRPISGEGLASLEDNYFPQNVDPKQSVSRPQPRVLDIAPAQASGYQSAALQTQPIAQLQHTVNRPQSALAGAVQSNGVFIQAGTFSRFSNAQKLASKLKGNQPDLPVKMHPVKIGGQQMFRVLIGPFKDNVKAQMYAGQLQPVDGRAAMIVYE